MNASKTHLLQRLELANFMIGSEDNPLELNYSSAYGGWQLTSNNGSHIEYHRVSAKEMLAFIDGLIRSDELYHSLAQGK